MNTEFLREFTVFAKYLNFTAAAKAIPTSQPTLSRHIAELEEELGCNLYTRDSDINLTYAGSVLLFEADKLLHCEKRLKEAVGDAKSVQCVRLKIENYPFMRTVMASTNKALDRLQNNHPELHVEVDFVPPKKNLPIYDSVLTGYFDIAVLAHTSFGEPDFSVPEGLEALPLRSHRSKIGFFVSNKNPLAQANEVSLHDMDGAEILVPINHEFGGYKEDIRSVFEAFGVAPFEVPIRFASMEDYSFGDLQNRILVVTESDLSTPTSPYLNNPNCTVVKCKEDVATTPFFVFRKDDSGIALQYFLEEMRQVLEDELQGI